jgi:hypothetical protein
LVELATSIGPVQDGRIQVEKINAPFPFTLKTKDSEFGAGLKFAVTRRIYVRRAAPGPERGCLELRESGLRRLLC